MQKFDDIKISTKTVIATTNISINLELLYATAPVYTTIPLHGKFKNKKELQQYIARNSIIPRGSILKVQYENNIRGIQLVKTKSKKFFRNVVSLHIYLDKLITVKIPKQGKIQMTGCKTDEHGSECIRYIWKMLTALKPTYPNIYTMGDHTNRLYATLLTVMSNINFNLGFSIDREAFDTYINTTTEFNSLLETSFGYTGINLKMPFEIDYEYPVQYIECIGDDQWVNGKLTYRAYVDQLCEKDRIKELGKKRRTTALVFFSGTVIFSSMNAHYMRSAYNNFTDIIIKARNLIEEVVEN